MAVALVVLSLAFVSLLAVFTPLQRVRNSIPSLALVFWFAAYNCIHGINALIWAGNVNIHVPVWCDIATKLMLGASIALPGALFCIAMQLELATSSKLILFDKNVLRNRTILELTLCYLIPVLYMLLHLVAQDRRFDLLEDYGCFPSTHPSTLAFLLIWIPPLTMSGIAFVFYGISIHNVGVLRGTYLTAHLEARSSMTASIFYRRLSTGMIISGSLILISLCSLFSVHSFQSWTSWQDVHALMSQVRVITSADDSTDIRFGWWAYFAVSCLYIVLAFAIGEEARDVYRWIGGLFKRRRGIRGQFRLPLFSLKNRPEEMSNNVSTKRNLQPLTVEIKSGWDDKWDNRPQRKGSTRSTKSSSPSSTSSPTKESIKEEDMEFMQSTLSYLSSPTAKALRTLSSPQMPPPAKILEPRHTDEIQLKSPTSPSLFKAPPGRNVPVDVEPSINSVFDAAWPIPPSSPTPSLPRPRHSSNSRSRSHSPDSSIEDSNGYPLHPIMTPPPPPPPSNRPFEDSCISPSSNTPPLNLFKKTLPKRPSLRSLRRTWSKERFGQGHGSVEAIHMTVVRETV